MVNWYFGAQIDAVLWLQAHQNVYLLALICVAAALVMSCRRRR